MSIFDNDRIQFPRLLSEVYAQVAREESLIFHLAESMDLSEQLVRNIFERAEKEFERIKDMDGNILAMYDALTQTNGLTPPDFQKCQAEITDPHGPFILGPKPGPRQCGNTPTYLAMEPQPDDQGRRGFMSVCDECRPNMPEGAAILFKLERS